MKRKHALAEKSGLYYCEACGRATATEEWEKFPKLPGVYVCPACAALIVLEKTNVMLPEAEEEPEEEKPKK